MSDNLIHEIEEMVSKGDWKKVLWDNRISVILGVLLLFSIFVGIGILVRHSQQSVYVNDLFSSGENALLEGDTSIAQDYFNKINDGGVYTCLSQWHLASISSLRGDFVEAVRHYDSLDDICADVVLTKAAMAFMDIASGSKRISENLKVVIKSGDYGKVFEWYGIFGGDVLVSWLLSTERFDELLSFIDYQLGRPSSVDLKETAMYKKLKILVTEQKEMLKDLLK